MKPKLKTKDTPNVTFWLCWMLEWEQLFLS